MFRATKQNLSYDKENRMATFAEDATLNTYTYDSDGLKKVENVGGSLSTIIWQATRVGAVSKSRKSATG